MNLLTVSEKDFFNQATRQFSASGTLATVIRQCICYNVTVNIIKKFSIEMPFPVTWEQPAMFAISEEGWRGNLDNIQTSYQTKSNTLQLKKDFVLESENLLLFSKYADQFALAALAGARNKSGIHWNSRNEPEIKFTDPNGAEYDHFRIHGEVSLSEANLTLVSSANYRRRAFNIPARELSCFAILALERLRINDSSFLEMQAELINLRAEEKSMRPLIQKSSEALDMFWEKNSIEKEDFWQWVKKLQSRLKK